MDLVRSTCWNRSSVLEGPRIKVVETPLLRQVPLVIPERIEILRHFDLRFYLTRDFRDKCEKYL